MRQAEIVVAAVICGLGFALAGDSWLIGAGWGKAGPDAGFFPFSIGVLLSLTALLLMVQAVRSPDGWKLFLDREQLVRVAKVAVPTVAVVALIQIIGFYIATTMFLTGYMRWIGRHSWGPVLAVGLGTPLLAFAFFEIWFLTPMRKGPVEIWLGF